jgi:hypothetical protein
MKNSLILSLECMNVTGFYLTNKVCKGLVEMKIKMFDKLIDIYCMEPSKVYHATR